jgi:biopolymer transport protein ExbB
MLGFLGTVIGMIRAFFELANAGNNIDPGLLAGGIYEALVTTAVGLFIGIGSYIAYNYLVALVDKAVFLMENTSLEFIDSLPEKK